MQQLITLDETLASSFSSLVAENPLIAKIFLTLGVGLVYLMPVLLIYVWFIYSKKLALNAAITGLLAWKGVSKLIAMIVDRPRPSESQIGVRELFFHRPDTSFPSDHASFLMAVAVAFYLSGQRKLGTFVLLIAVAVGVSRVAIGVHFPGDILAGWLVGAATAYLLYLIRDLLDKYLLEPGVHLARKFRL